VDRAAALAAVRHERPDEAASCSSANCGSSTPGCSRAAERRAPGQGA
jgi:hypothetical protein